MQNSCPFCSFPIYSESFNFCPNCGKKLKEPPVTVTRQIWIYAISIFLPPLGLWPGIRYLLQKDGKKKAVGFIAITLTIISTIITLWLTIAVFNGAMLSVNSQLKSYQNLTQ